MISLWFPWIFSNHHPSPRPLHRVVRRDVIGRRGELRKRPVDRRGIGLREGPTGAVRVEQFGAQEPAAAVEGQGTDAVPTAGDDVVDGQNHHQTCVENLEKSVANVFIKPGTCRKGSIIDLEMSMMVSF